MGLRVMVPLAVSSLELGLLDIGDQIISGPFEGPYEYFLKRHAIALVEEIRGLPA